MKKPLSASISTLALAISANLSLTAHAANQMEVVIVTASKIETDIQQTAVSMQSISADTLANAGVGSLAEVAKFTPGLQLDQIGGGLTASVRIRGIGTPGNSPLDPSVPIFIDGVAQGRTGSGFQDLLDVARVEILRGPQGTLFGRNSTAGAISVWTKDANTRDWGGSLQVQAGNYNDREVKGTVNVPIIDDVLAARISGFSVNQDGYAKNAMDGETYNGYADRHGVRGKFAWTPTENIDVQWVSDYSNTINHPLLALNTYPAAMDAYATTRGIASAPDLSGAALQANGLPVPDPYDDTQYFDHTSWTEDTNVANSITVNWDIQDGFLAGNTLTSITSYQNYKADQDTDREYTPLQWAETSGLAKTVSKSQELRISSDALENWEYVAGLFYYTEHVQSDQRNDGIFADKFAALGIPGVRTPSNAFSHTTIDTDNAAIFGQVTYSVTDDFSLTAGLRGSRVERDGNSDVDVLIQTSPTSTPINPYAGTPTGRLVLIDDETLAENDVSGVLKALYFIGADIMLYGSYDRGFKPGGFNRLLDAGASGTVATSYRKENSNNFEVGLKSQWLDNRVQANLAVFYMDFKDYHNQYTDPSSQLIVENVKSVTTEGVELDVQVLLTDNLTGGLSAAYLNPRVKDDTVDDDQSGGTGHSRTLKNGQLINDVSQYSANIFAEYNHPVADSSAEAFIRGDLSYRSSYLLGTTIDLAHNPSIYQGGFSTSNLRFGLRNLDDHWTLTGWVKNLTDKEYAVAGAIGVGGQMDGSYIVPGAPRTYGVAVQYDY